MPFDPYFVFPFFRFRTTEKGLLLSLDRLQKGLKARFEPSNNNKCNNNNNSSSYLFNSSNFSTSSKFNNSSNNNNNNSLRNSNKPCNSLSISKGILHLPHHLHRLLLLHLRNNEKISLLKFRKKFKKGKKLFFGVIVH